MKRFLFTLMFFLFFALVQTLPAQTNFKTYGNARFGYTISYPANLLTPRGEADNGDGQAFTGEGVTLIVFGSNHITEGSMRRDFEESLKEFGAKNLTYKLYKKDYYVVSGIKDGKILYQKTMKKPGGVYVSFVIEYEESKRAVYDKLVPAIAKSFK